MSNGENMKVWIFSGHADWERMGLTRAFTRWEDAARYAAKVSYDKWQYAIADGVTEEDWTREFMDRASRMGVAEPDLCVWSESKWMLGMPIDEFYEPDGWFCLEVGELVGEEARNG